MKKRDVLVLMGLCLVVAATLLFTSGDFVKKLEIKYAELTQEYFDKNDFCFAGGKKVKISDTEAAQLYGQDLYVLPFGGVVTDAFCIGNHRTTNKAIFVIEGQKPIVEQVTLETTKNISILMIRPNGFNVVGIK